MTSAFTPDGTSGGAFVTEAGTYAVADSEVTSADPDAIVSFAFRIERRSLVFMVGTEAGHQDIVPETTLGPGDHLQSFSPGVSPYYIRFELRETGEAVLSGLARVAPGVMSLSTPWSEAEIPALRSEQSRDVQWWCCPTKAPRVLERRGTSSWSLRLFQPKDGPFEPPDASGVTLTPSSRTGTATVAASAPVFSVADTGSLLRLTQTGQYQTLAAAGVDEVTDSIRITGQGANRLFFYKVSGTFSATWALQRSVGTELDWQTVASGAGAVDTSLNDALENQIVFYRLRVTAYTSGSPVLELIHASGVTDGVGRIYSVDADNLVTVDVLEPFATTTPTYNWARGSWSDRLGWPTAVALDPSGRLAFVRAARRWQSTSDDFESFLAGPDEADAISGVIPGPINAPRWLKSGSRLFLGTGGGVGDISSGAFDEVMTPDNARAKIRRERGSFDADAVMADSGPAYIMRSGRKIGLVIEDGDALKVVDLTRLHRDIAGPGDDTFVELAWQSDPEMRLWAVRQDGQCAVLLLNLDERIAGWCRYVPVGAGAAIESVCCIPGTPEDSIAFVVRRVVNGVTVRLVEKLAPEQWTDMQQAVRLQAAEVYSGEATTTLGGFDHLIGEDVHVWGNGRISGPLTVNESGQVTLTYGVTHAVGGLKYQGFYKGPKRSTVGDRTKLDHLVISMLNTIGGGLSWGPDFDRMETLADRETLGASYDAPLPLFSRDEKFPFTGSWSRDSRVCLRHNGVGPSTVLALRADGDA